MPGYIPDHIIADIKHAADIVDIISESVQLKKAGKDYIGLCPFHSEKTPSFSVSRDKQIFYCFGCGTGGNVFSFCMKHDGLSFPEAARMLAGKYGIQVPEQNMSVEQKRRFTEKERLYDINKEAMDFFSGMLRSQTGMAAKAYLERSRRLSTEIIEAFTIGYAPEGWDHLMRYLTGKGRTVNDIEKAGLIIRRKSGTGFYDRFRSRIIFPIIDTRMRTIGFGGRIMDDSSPKYLNSPETPVYNKSRSLYGLHRAGRKCRETGQIYLVEGYLDAIALHQHGIDNTVATLGTALTPEHARLMKGYAQQAVLVYDADEAGLRAAERVERILNADLDVRIASLPRGHDPDSFISQHGKDAFLKETAKATSIFVFRMNRAIEKHGLSIQGKIRIIAELKQPISALSDDVVKKLYIKELAERVGIEEAVIQKEISKVTPGRPPVNAYAMPHAEKSNPPMRPTPDTADIRINKTEKMEREIISMMLQYPVMNDEIRTKGILEYFGDDHLKNIGRMVLDTEARDPGMMVSSIMDRLEHDADKNKVAALAIKENDWKREGCLQLISHFESKHGYEKTWREKLKRAGEKNPDEQLLAAQEKLIQERKRQMT